MDAEHGSVGALPRRHGRTFLLAFFSRTNDKYRQVMMSRWCARSVVVVFVALLAGSAQTASSSPAKPDYSQEAAVIEELTTKIAFDNDGDLTRQQTSRVRVQTDGGVQQWGLLSFPFQSATQTVEIDYVRVRKPDGSTLVTPPDNVQDLDAEITRSAPFYSDLREKHVAVKGLAKGDTLEYEAHWHSLKPLVPGQFWFQYSFHHDGIVLAERLEIKVPGERAVKVKGPQSTQAVTTDGGTRIYSWTYSKLENPKEPDSDQKKATEAALGRLPAPDVQISSFQSWEDVGRWYFNLQKDRIEPTAAIRAKAAELTKGLTSDADKLRALYSFVSLQYRYIGIAFGIGRYQPHSADDVLSNNYGDCKDKHTLLASLLQASGIPLYPALINSAVRLDPDVPSPAQFDHVIGYLPPDKNKDGKDALWLDTTPEVGPFGYLLTVLRDKQALVMQADKPALLITTPADPPFPGAQTFKIRGKLSDNGTLDAKVEDTTRGDSEVVVRYTFRRVPQPQWKDLVQQISQALGFAGTVSDVTASAPEALAEPFHFSYSYNRKDYPDWSNHQFTVPGLPFFMPQLKDDAKDPVWLGSPRESISDSKVELPQGYKPQLPSNVDLKYDFAEYHASYSQDQSVLLSERRLVIKLREVPVAEFDDYRNFLKRLQNDLNQYVQTSSSNSSQVQSFHLSGVAPLLLSGIRDLPESSSSAANRLEGDARAAIALGDRSAAITAVKQALEADPKFTRAWLELGAIYSASGEVDADPALDALRKAIDSDPKQMLPRRIYAYALVRLSRPEAAMDAWRGVLEIAPNDSEANSGLAFALMQQKRYSEAVPYMEASAKGDNSSAAWSRLGSAYLQAGQIEKGTATLEKAVEADPRPEVLNDLSYQLAEANASLPKALEWAQRAVDEHEKSSREVKLSNLHPDDPRYTLEIGYYWDTLGWVHFRLGHLAQAESYLNAAWVLTQMGVPADHLGQVYEQEHQPAKAIQMYRFALAASTPETQMSGDDFKETRKRLARLTSETIDASGSSRNGINLYHMRLIGLPRFIPGRFSAEFFLLFGPGPKLEDVKFISGSQNLKGAGKVLTSAKFPVTFPDGSSARLLRRAMVMCVPVSGCQVLLLTPDQVHSVN
jgi:tetratricopeptide (TPR) repeat protein/transglutaminase-like putative cysteine protease